MTKLTINEEQQYPFDYVTHNSVIFAIVGIASSYPKKVKYAISILYN